MSEQKMVITGWERGRRLRCLSSSEVVAIYPITPSSPMAEWADQWRSEGKKNIWGALPVVEELQSEGGAAGALHGALQAGAFATTFTASQGLLLMIPNMYKIAGELTPATMHVTARTLATHALSIFGDHSDVMACRSTGWAMLAPIPCRKLPISRWSRRSPPSNPAFLSSFLRWIPHFARSRQDFPISDETIRAMLDDKYIVQSPPARAQPRPPDHSRHRAESRRFLPGARSLQPHSHAAARRSCSTVMDRFAALTGRAYHLFDYVGAPDAERVIILMGSGAEAVEEAVDALLNRRRKSRPAQGAAYPAIFRRGIPCGACRRPSSPSRILDRTKEPGAAGRAAVSGHRHRPRRRLRRTCPFPAMPRVIGGRYGLSPRNSRPPWSRPFSTNWRSPRQESLHDRHPRRCDATPASTYDPDFSTEDPRTVRALFYGLGSDGTVGANKNSIKIIGSETRRITRRDTSSTTQKNPAR